MRGTRIPVATILGLLGAGLTPAEVIGYHPQLVVDDVLACLRYAADLTNERSCRSAGRNEPPCVVTVSGLGGTASSAWRYPVPPTCRYQPAHTAGPRARDRSAGSGKYSYPAVFTSVVGQWMRLMRAVVSFQ